MNPTPKPLALTQITLMPLRLKRSGAGGLTSNTPSRDSRLHLGLLRIWEPWLLSSLLTASLLNGICSPTQNMLIAYFWKIANWKSYILTAVKITQQAGKRISTIKIDFPQ